MKTFTFKQQELEAALTLSAPNQPLTGYWQIQFDDGQGLDSQSIWHLFVCRGRVIFSGFEQISWSVVLETLKLYIPSLRSDAAKEKIQEIEQEEDGQSPQSMLALLSKLILQAKLTTYQEVIEAIKLKILTDIDKYLFDYSGQAEFIAEEKLKDKRPIIGFELDDLLFTAKQRRKQWEEISSFVPSMESIVQSDIRQIEMQKLTVRQKEQLEKIIRSGKSLQQISYDLGEDGLKLAKTFAKLVQKKLVTFNSDNLSPIAQPETPPEFSKTTLTQPETPPEFSKTTLTQPETPPEFSKTTLTQPGTPPEFSKTTLTQPETPLEFSKTTLTQPGTPPEGAELAGAEVFIVDDSMIILKNFKALVSQLGYSVKCFDNAHNALEAMIAAANPAIIFLDINMPEMSGFQLVKLIRSQPKLASVPLILLTAERSLLNKQRAKWSKSKFLSKPLSVEEIPNFKSELKALLQELAPIRTQEEKETIVTPLAVNG